MDLHTYFNETSGFGVLSTADGEGKVDAAVYARPHVLEDGTLVFVMRDRLTHENLKTNPHAVFLFKEEGPGYKGCRLFLTRIRETDDPEEAKRYQRRKTGRSYPGEARFVVYFQLDKHLPLVGAGEEP